MRSAFHWETMRVATARSTSPRSGALSGIVLSDAGGDVWVLGTAADSRTASLAGLEAPDFALPDLSGVQHRLSDLRGRKLFLTTWASW
jgi:hypothetical protein